MRTILGGLGKRIPRPTPAMGVALLALLIACSGAAVAAIPSSDGTISACRDNRTGALRVIDAASAQTCSSKETQLAWKDGIHGKVADSLHADQADNATNAANADTVDGKNASDFYAAGSKVADSELLDGKDSAAFFSGSTYMVTSQPTDNSPGSHTNIALRCDIGDVALGGGYESLDPSEGTVRANEPLDVHTVFGVHQAWNVQWVNQAPSLNADVVVMVRCADFGQAHQ
jgi:hypothetical protein